MRRAEESWRPLPSNGPQDGQYEMRERVNGSLTVDLRTSPGLRFDFPAPPVAVALRGQSRIGIGAYA
jgi:hypothetical protein